MPDVLVTSASRKVLLVRAFRDALARLGGGRVIAADLSPLAAALYEADAARIVPPSDTPEFVHALLDLCAADHVGLVVPTRDDELPVLAASRSRFSEAGTLVLVSSPEAIDTCRDKRRFQAAIESAGLDAPISYPDPETCPLPAFVKPRWGAGGRGAGRVDTRQAARAAVDALDGEAVIQEFVQAREFTVDVFLDLDGRPITCVPRERLQVVAGESTVSRTVHDAALVDATLLLCASIGLVGHVTVQAFRSPERIAFIEINPRYGGAANLGFVAGAHTPELAIRMARGERLASRLGAYVPGIVMLRHAEDRFVPESDLLGAPP